MGDYQGGVGYSVDRGRPGRVFGSGEAEKGQFPQGQAAGAGLPGIPSPMPTVIAPVAQLAIGPGRQGVGLSMPSSPFAMFTARDTSSLPTVVRNQSALDEESKNRLLFLAMAGQGASQNFRPFRGGMQMWEAQLLQQPSFPHPAGAGSSGLNGASFGGGDTAGNRGPVAEELKQSMPPSGSSGSQRSREAGEAQGAADALGVEPLRGEGSCGASRSGASASSAEHEDPEQEESPGNQSSGQKGGGAGGEAGSGGRKSGGEGTPRKRLDPCLREGAASKKKAKKVDPCLADGLVQGRLPAKRPTKLKEIVDATSTGHEDLADLCEALEDLSERLPYTARMEKSTGQWAKWLQRVQGCRSVRRLADELEWFGRQIHSSVLITSWQKDERAGWHHQCKSCTHRDSLVMLLEDLESAIDCEMTKKLFDKEKQQEIRMQRKAEKVGKARAGQPPTASMSAPRAHEGQAAKTSRSSSQRESPNGDKAVAKTGRPRQGAQGESSSRKKAAGRPAQNSGHATSRAAAAPSVRRSRVAAEKSARGPTAPRRPSARSDKSSRAALLPELSEDELHAAELLTLLSASKRKPSKGSVREESDSDDGFEIEASSTPLKGSSFQEIRRALVPAEEEQQLVEEEDDRVFIEELSDEVEINEASEEEGGEEGGEEEGEEEDGEWVGPARESARAGSGPDPSPEVVPRASRTGRGKVATPSPFSTSSEAPADARLAVARPDDNDEEIDSRCTEVGGKHVEHGGGVAEGDRAQHDEGCAVPQPGAAGAQGGVDAEDAGVVQANEAAALPGAAASGGQEGGDGESAGGVEGRGDSLARQHAIAGEEAAVGGHSEGRPSTDPDCKTGVQGSTLHGGDAGSKVAGGRGEPHGGAARQGRVHGRGEGTSARAARQGQAKAGRCKVVGIAECRKMIIKLNTNLPYDAMLDPLHETWRLFRSRVLVCRMPQELAATVVDLCDKMRPEVMEKKQKKGWITRLKSCESLTELRSLICGLRKNIDFSAAMGLVAAHAAGGRAVEEVPAELALAPKRPAARLSSSADAKKRKLHEAPQGRLQAGSGSAVRKGGGSIDVAVGDERGSEGGGGKGGDADAVLGTGMAGSKISDGKAEEVEVKPSKKMLDMCRKSLVKFSEKLPYSAMQDEKHSTWSEFTRSVKRCGTASELAQKLLFFASQVKPRVLARGWIRQHRDAWKVSLERCVSLNGFQEAMAHFRCCGVDMLAAMSTARALEEADEMLAARLLENKVTEPDWGKGDKESLLSQWKDWSKEIRLTAEEVGVLETVVEHVWTQGSMPPEGAPRVMRRQAPMRPFKCIKKNLYRTQKPRSDPSEEAQICRCSLEEGKCCEDDECLNRAIFVECDAALCPLGVKCCNQRLRRQQYPKSKVAFTQDRGHGLFAEEDIKQGQLVHEYIGEVIHRDTWKERLGSYDDETPVYFFALGSLFIDASEYGSLARFMNHSCTPNCFAQKWSVDQEDRVGIFAKQDIKKGDELMYNYGFEVHGVRHRCCCGAPNCTGYLGKEFT